MNGLFAQAAAGVFGVINLVVKIADVPIDIDRFGFSFHCRSYLVSTGSSAPARAQS